MRKMMMAIIRFFRPQRISPPSISPTSPTPISPPPISPTLSGPGLRDRHGRDINHPDFGLTTPQEDSKDAEDDDGDNPFFSASTD
jgi:hypothetical protein